MKRKLIRITNGDETMEMLSADAADYLHVTMTHITNTGREGGMIRGCWVKTVGEVDVKMQRECERCGAPIKTRNPTRFCEDCRSENQEASLDRWGIITKRAKQPDGGTVPYEKRSELSRVAYDARRAGMSYGQYVGRML